MFQFTLPKLTAAGDAGQNAQLKNYLYQLTEQLQYALSNIDAENFTEAVRQQYEGAKDVPARVAALAEAAGANSARTEALRDSLDSVDKTLQERYESLSAALQETADSIESSYQSEIEQAENRISTAVANDYTLRTETEALSASVESRFTQTAADMMAIFDAAYDYTGDDGLQQFCDAFRTFIRFSSDGVEIGKSDSLITAKLSNDRLAFVQPGSTSANDYAVAYISDKKLYITEAQVLKAITFGADEHGRLFDLKADEHGLTLTCRPVAVDPAQGEG